MPSLPTFETTFVEPRTAVPATGRRWIIGLVVVVAVLAVVCGTALVLGHSQPTTSTSSGPPTTQVSPASEADRFLATEYALSAQGLPDAKTAASDIADGSNALLSSQAQINQIEQASEAASAASLNPTSPQSQAEQQCVNSADGQITNGESVTQMIASFQQCTQPTADAATAPVQQATQVAQAALAQVKSDLQNADAAMQSLAGITHQESTVASEVVVPSSLASQKQALLAALEVATADALEGSGSATLSGAQTSILQYAGAIGSVGTQENSLVTAMKG